MELVTHLWWRNGNIYVACFPALKELGLLLKLVKAKTGYSEVACPITCNFYSTTLLASTNDAANGGGQCFPIQDWQQAMHYQFGVEAPSDIYNLRLCFLPLSPLRWCVVFILLPGDLFHPVLQMWFGPCLLYHILLSFLVPWILDDCSCKLCFFRHEKRLTVVTKCAFPSSLLFFSCLCVLVVLICTFVLLEWV